MSVIAVLLPGVKLYFVGKLDRDMVMETFVACFIFLCSYLLAKVLIQYGHDNITAIISSHEKSTKNELAFLQAQIKPHFLYNSINTIVSFCYTDNEKAANLLVNLSKYLRLVFDIDRQSMLVLLEREIEVTKAYADIEKARFGELVNVEYDIEPELLSKEIPSLCIQPLVENAIKHGLLKKVSGGTVNILIKKSDGAITVKIADNGIGMSAEKLVKLKNAQSAGEGVGFANVLRRIEIWPNARFDIQSAEDEGTTVTITIPDAFRGGAYD